MAGMGRRALAAGLLTSGAAWAQAPRRRPGETPGAVRLFSPFAPGSGDDRLNRLLAERLAPLLGAPEVTVEARPGANTVAAAAAMAQAPADGRSLLVTTSSTAMNNLALYPSLPYWPARDLVPVSLLWVSGLVFAAPAAAPFADMPGCVRWVDRQGRAVTYGSWGMGTAAHVFGELLKREQGIPLEHVTFPNQPAAMAELLAGRLDLTFVSPANGREALAAGTVRALGVVGDRRCAALPGVPTFGEQGLPGFDLPIFTATYLPGGTPRAAVDRLHGALARALNDPALREAMRGQGHTAVGSTPEELAAVQVRDTPRWAALISASGARMP